MFDLTHLHLLIYNVKYIYGGIRKMKNIIKVVLLTTIWSFILTGCGNTEYIDATYYNVNNKENYIILSKDGFIKNSLWTEYNNGEEKIRDCFTYNIIDNNLIAIDQTEYAGESDKRRYNVGTLYKDYICSKWDGIIYDDYFYTELSFQMIEDINLKIVLKADKSYEYTINEYGESVFFESGSYNINDNMVTLTNNDENILAIFINVDGTPYCIEYQKQ